MDTRPSQTGPRLASRAGPSVGPALVEIEYPYVRVAVRQWAPASDAVTASLIGRRSAPNDEPCRRCVRARKATEQENCRPLRKKTCYFPEYFLTSCLLLSQAFVSAELMPITHLREIGAKNR